ncbi:hypothetical protein M5K25_004840 [Dendrobium thyrsiflorum]|uniref:SHSP domain-containing protein n=1 Tax=Dendrobium thyrsiflorum TaxID=117978 RepID=A0ABD0VH33_DENTH
MDGKFLDLQSLIFPSLQHVVEDVPGEREKLAQFCLREMRARVSTPANIKELLSAYEFEVDMPGVKSGEIKVQIEDGKKLTIEGERRRDENDKEGGKYIAWSAGSGNICAVSLFPITPISKTSQPFTATVF